MKIYNRTPALLVRSRISGTMFWSPTSGQNWLPCNITNYRLELTAAWEALRCPFRKDAAAFANVSFQRIKVHHVKSKCCLCARCPGFFERATDCWNKMTFNGKGRQGELRSMCVFLKSFSHKLFFLVVLAKNTHCTADAARRKRWRDLTQKCRQTLLKHCIIITAHIINSLFKQHNFISSPNVRRNSSSSIWKTGHIT